MNWLRFFAGFANVPDHLMDDIEKAWPGATRLRAALKKIGPDLQALEPIMARITPVIIAEIPDIEAIAPVVEEAMEFADSKGTTP